MGRDIFKELMGSKCAGLDWLRPVSLTTEDVPAMCSEKVGFSGILKEKLNSLCIPRLCYSLYSVSKKHCSEKKVQMKNVMGIVLKNCRFLGMSKSI